MSIKNRRRRLWMEDSRCRKCGRVTVLPQVARNGVSGKFRHPDNMATIQHMYSKLSALRGTMKGEVTTLWCHKCNEEDSIEDQYRALQEGREVGLISKVFLGTNICRDELKESSLIRRVKNVQVIWRADCYGIERIVRLLLAVSQFVFPGTYVRQIFGKHSSIYRDISIDILVVVKVLFSITIIYFHLQTYTILMVILVWFSIETLLYIPTMIFASDYLSRPRSYKRSMILFFINYLQVTIDFACFYSYGNNMNKPFEHWYTAIYFSFVTGSSTGYGDYYPVTGLGELLVSVQAVVFLVFIALFFNILSNKMDTTGYFKQ